MILAGCLKGGRDYYLWKPAQTREGTLKQQDAMESKDLFLEEEKNFHAVTVVSIRRAPRR